MVTTQVVITSVCFPLDNWLLHNGEYKSFTLDSQPPNYSAYTDTGPQKN